MPGTPSISTCPPAKKAMRISSITSLWPTMTLRQLGAQAREDVAELVDQRLRRAASAGAGGGQSAARAMRERRTRCRVPACGWRSVAGGAARLVDRSRRQGDRRCVSARSFAGEDAPDDRLVFRGDLELVHGRVGELFVRPAAGSGRCVRLRVGRRCGHAVVRRCGSIWLGATAVKAPSLIAMARACSASMLRRAGGAEDALRPLLPAPRVRCRASPGRRCSALAPGVICCASAGGGRCGRRSSVRAAPARRRRVAARRFAAALSSLPAPLLVVGRCRRGCRGRGVAEASVAGGAPKALADRLAQAVEPCSSADAFTAARCPPALADRRCAAGCRPRRFAPAASARRLRLRRSRRAGRSRRRRGAIGAGRR